jgi:hypothetical protein
MRTISKPDQKNIKPTKKKNKIETILNDTKHNIKTTLKQCKNNVKAMHNHIQTI